MAHNRPQTLIRPNVRLVPIATDALQQMASLFDHLVGALLQEQRHVEA